MNTAQQLRPMGAGVADACQAALRHEPALVVGMVAGIVDAGLVVLFAFVTVFTAEQQVALIGFISVVTTAVGTLATRSRVSPVARV